MGDTVDAKLGEGLALALRFDERTGDLTNLRSFLDEAAETQSNLYMNAARRTVRRLVCKDHRAELLQHPLAQLFPCLEHLTLSPLGGGWIGEPVDLQNLSGIKEIVFAKGFFDLTGAFAPGQEPQKLTLTEARVHVLSSETRDSLRKVAVKKGRCEVSTDALFNEPLRYKLSALSSGFAARVRVLGETGDGLCQIRHNVAQILARGGGHVVLELDASLSGKGGLKEIYPAERLEVIVTHPLIDAREFRPRRYATFDFGGDTAIAVLPFAGAGTFRTELVIETTRGIWREDLGPPFDRLTVLVAPLYRYATEGGRVVSCEPDSWRVLFRGNVGVELVRHFLKEQAAAESLQINGAFGAKTFRLAFEAWKSGTVRSFYWHDDIRSGAPLKVLFPTTRSSQKSAAKIFGESGRVSYKGRAGARQLRLRLRCRRSTFSAKKTLGLLAEICEGAAFDQIRLDVWMSDKHKFRCVEKLAETVAARWTGPPEARLGRAGSPPQKGGAPELEIASIGCDTDPPPFGTGPLPPNIVLR